MRKALLFGFGAILLVVAAMLLLAGVLTLTDPGPPTAEDGVPIRGGGSLDTNQTALWEWTQTAVGRDVNATPYITIRDLGNFGDRREQRVRGFEQRLLAPDDAAESNRRIAALAYPSPLSIALDAEWLPSEWNHTSRQRVNTTLVHEFTHIVQFETEAYTDARRDLRSQGDRGRTFTALTEGGATYVEDAYASGSRRTALETAWESPTMPARERYSLWAYYRGLAYFEARIDDPADLWSVYRDPPQTTARILRGDAPAENPPDRLVATGELDGYRLDDRGRVGAGFAEVLLAAATEPDRAREIAIGWEWDGLRTFEPALGATSPDAPRHVWITEWSNASTADGFESGLSSYLDSHWNGSAGTWALGEDSAARIERVDADAVALVVGPEAFLAEVEVSSDGEGYAIESTGTSGASPTASAGDAPVGPVGA